MMGLGWPELLIILGVAVLLFGGTRLAGIGKASGRAIREFKEETKDLGDGKKKGKDADPAAAAQPATAAGAQQPGPQNDAPLQQLTQGEQYNQGQQVPNNQNQANVYDAEIVDDNSRRGTHRI